MRSSRVVVALAVAGTLALASWATVAQESPDRPATAPQSEKPSPKAPAEKPDQEQPKSAPAPINIQIVSPPKSEAEREEERREKAEKAETDKRLVDLTADLAKFTQWLAYATGALVIVTGGLVYFAVRRANDMKESIAVAGRSAKAAARAALAAENSAVVSHDALVASNRSWLKYTPIVGESALRFDALGAYYDLSIKIKNIGNAPALHINPRAWMLCVRADRGWNVFKEHERRLAAAAGESRIGDYCLFPGETFPDGEGISVSLGTSLSLEDIASGLQAGNVSGIVIYLGGCVDYSSSIDPAQIHRTWFLIGLNVDMRPVVFPSDQPIMYRRITFSQQTDGIGNGAR